MFDRLNIDPGVTHRNLHRNHRNQLNPNLQIPLFRNPLKLIIRNQPAKFPIAQILITNNKQKTHIKEQQQSQLQHD
jgi:hypothetical protein